MLWLLKDNVLQDITNKTIYKTSLTRKLTIAMHLQKISWGLCDVHNGNPKPNSLIIFIRSLSWSNGKNTGFLESIF